MIHFKNKPGFTLIETVIAMAIFAAIFAPLFAMQGNVIQRVGKISRYIHRTILMRNFLLEARRENKQEETEFTFEKKIDNPPTTLKYQLRPVDKKSSLSTQKGINLEQITGTWEENGQRFNDTIMTMIYKIPESKK